MEEIMLRETVLRGAEGQKQEGRGSRRSSPYKKCSKRSDLRGEDERTHKQLRVEVSKATAHVIRHHHEGHIRFEMKKRSSLW